MSMSSLPQLNKAVSLIQAPEEREQLAELNLCAALRAKALCAYSACLGYLEAAATMLRDSGRPKQPELARLVALHTAECEYLLGMVDSAEREDRCPH
ncbi:hypothetical protein ACU4GD_31950 [Cupriavidus basilensis]